jgi:multiple sugar transport system ATP-binding protein
MTVYENMAFALKLRNVARAEIDQRVREAARILSIEDMLDRKPRQLSGGQRQRVAVGRAIVRQPQAFLFDEPLSNLDAKLRVQMRKEISRLHRQLGATMIYVTHDQVEAMTMGDRIVVMNAGQIQQIGTPLELYERPANQFVAGFIGSPAMNMWRGMVREQDGRAVFASDGFQLDVGRAPGVPRDRDIVLGLRPENIYYAAGPYVPSPAAEITSSIDVIEPMGNETLLYTRAGAADIVARIAPQEIPDVDEPIRLAVDLNRLHCFDATTGERVSA